MLVSVAIVDPGLVSVMVSTLALTELIAAGANALATVGVGELVNVQVIAAVVAMVRPNFMAEPGMVMLLTPTVLEEATGFVLPVPAALASLQLIAVVIKPAAGVSVTVCATVGSALQVAVEADPTPVTLMVCGKAIATPAELVNWVGPVKLKTLVPVEPAAVVFVIFSVG